MMSGYRVLISKNLMANLTKTNNLNIIFGCEAYFTSTMKLKRKN